MYVSPRTSIVQQQLCFPYTWVSLLSQGQVLQGIIIIIILYKVWEIIFQKIVTLAQVSFVSVSMIFFAGIFHERW